MIIYKGLIVALLCIPIGYACQNIKTRQKWGAISAKAIEYQPIPVPTVIIHQTRSNPCSTFESCSNLVASMQQSAIVLWKYDDIGYNFLIGNDGNIYEGVGWLRAGNHTSGFNTESIGIAFIGNFFDVLPSEGALEAAKSLIKCGVESGHLSRFYRLFYIRQLNETEILSDMLYDEIQKWDHWTISP